MSNFVSAWEKAARPSIDGLRRMRERAEVQVVPGACLWIALIVVVVRTGGG
ncbi:MAG: hypothetical protein ABSC92_13755 [Rhizomicrobium sp.]